MCMTFDVPCKPVSHPAWGAWIEMRSEESDYEGLFVAPRMGCVD